MKKLLFALPVVLLLAAGCSSNQPVVENQPNNTQPTQNQQTTPPPTNTQATPPARQTTPTPSPTTNPTTEPVPAGYTAYKKSNGSFTFNYPSDWYIANIKNDPDMVELRSFQGSAGSGQGLLSQAEIGVEFSKTTNNTQDVKTWCESSVTKAFSLLAVQFSNGHATTVSGNNAYEVDYQIKEDARINGRQICVAKGSNKYVLLAFPVNSNQMADFDKIVASFKITK